MATEQVKQFLQAVATDPRAGRILESMAAPENEAAEFRAYLDLAEKLGYAVGEEDLRRAIGELNEETAARTEETAGRIRELSADELSEAAGGGDHGNCSDTFRDEENCWYNDGCDVIFRWYNNYNCKYTKNQEPPLP